MGFIKWKVSSHKSREILFISQDGFTESIEWQTCENPGCFDYTKIDKDHHILLKVIWMWSRIGSVYNYRGLYMT